MGNFNWEILLFKAIGFIGVTWLAFIRMQKHRWVNTLIICVSIGLITATSYDVTSVKFWAELAITMTSMFAFYFLMDKLWDAEDENYPKK